MLLMMQDAEDADADQQYEQQPEVMGADTELVVILLLPTSHDEQKRPHHHQPQHAAVRPWLRTASETVPGLSIAIAQ